MVKSTSIPALPVLVGELPLEIRRKQLSSNDWDNLQAHREDHPTEITVKSCWEQNGSCRATMDGVVIAMQKKCKYCKQYQTEAYSNHSGM